VVEQTAVTDDTRGNKVKFRGVFYIQACGPGAIHIDKSGDIEEHTGIVNDNDNEFPSIEKLLVTTSPKEGSVARDQRPDNTAFGVGMLSLRQCYSHGISNSLFAS
jgi:hypothetical protein